MQKFSFLLPGQLHFYGRQDDDVRFIRSWQLMDRPLWAKFVNQFRTHSDGDNGDWRGEYWGKMMRGACLCYTYTKDEELYSVLEETVLDLLTTQDSFGRISTYSVQTQLYGWDLWCRKYVLTGLQHFYAICRNQQLRARMLTAMCRHTDAIMALVGPDKTPITATSSAWGAVNSCTLLEPVVALYRLSGEERYLSFAAYILSTGGCADGDLLQAALDNKLPHEYPTVKAYEVMSFFEGVLAYHEVTGERRCLQAVTNFVHSVIEHEISVIGCAGCEHELFDHTAQTQTYASCQLQQETCVTVTYMRLLTRLLQLTGDVRYAHALERPAYNAMPGSINHTRQPGWDYWGEAQTEALPFDSYSPLRDKKRGLGIGGLKHLPEGGVYGCCACIGSAGVALIPLTAFMASRDGFVINDFYPGRITADTPAGAQVCFTAAGDYLQHGTYSLTVQLRQPEHFTIRLRIPEWCQQAEVRIGAQSICAQPGYCELVRQWQDGDRLELILGLSVRRQMQDGLTAYFYGPLTLCRDDAKQENMPCPNEQYRTTQDGLLLTDYASCGKTNTPITVWQ